MDALSPQFQAGLALAAGVLCSVCIALLLRWAEHRQASRIVVIASNYVTTTVAGLLFWGTDGFPAIPLRVVVLGLLGGTVFIGTFLLMTAAIGKIGIAIPISVTRLSVVVPVLYSMAVYGERPGSLGFAGLALALAALALFGVASKKAVARTAAAGHAGAATLAKPKPGLQAWLSVVTLFLSMGAVEVVLKTYKEMHAPGEPYQPFGFLMVVFGSAVVIAWIWVAVRGARVRRRDVGAGLLLGIPNILSTYFMLLALRGLPGVVAFPVNSLSIIILGTLAGMAFWKEKPTAGVWFALGLAALAIAAVNLGRFAS